MRIAEAARKHGIPDQDIMHALRHAFREAERDDLTMLIGAATDGELLEIGVLDLEGDDPVVIHAMTARPRFL